MPSPSPPERGDVLREGFGDRVDAGLVEVGRRAVGPRTWAWIGSDVQTLQDSTLLAIPGSFTFTNILLRFVCDFKFLDARETAT